MSQATTSPDSTTQTAMVTDGLFSVAGKTAVVTGGSQGVGLMIARGLVAGGAHVYISSHLPEVCDEAAAELSALPGGGTCVSLPADLSTEDGCRGLAAAVREREDALDILVNNAGVMGNAFSMGHITHQVWRGVLSVNLEAVFFLTRELLPLLEAASRDGDPARVVNTGSVAGLEPSDLDSYPYSTSKAAVHQLTSHLARRLAPRITVNAIAPYAFESGMMKTTLALFGEAVAEQVPLKRIGRPDDIAGTVIFLTSPAGAYLTGAVIPIDGGASTT
jgi:NAD(P)-dependent dehydrogenase (short-subunit alcohol dehydrogenase family)